MTDRAAQANRGEGNVNVSGELVGLHVSSNMADVREMRGKLECGVEVLWLLMANVVERWRK